MTFDIQIDRRNTHSSKWDMMEPLYGVSPENGLAMWVADMRRRHRPLQMESVHSLPARTPSECGAQKVDCHSSMSWAAAQSSSVVAPRTLSTSRAKSQ